MSSISLDAAMLVTGISKRTLWRRIAEGKIQRLDDQRGRAMVALDDILPLLCVPIEPEDYKLLIDADAGDSDAQNDLAQLFFDEKRLDIGMYWLHLAVDQEHADAIHNLSKMYIRGVGMEKDATKGLMWLAKAASLGHPIAQQQVAALQLRDNL